MPKIDARFVEKKTPIFTTIIDDYQSINYHVKKHILEMRKQNPQGIESNVRAWRSHWFTHKITKVFDPLVKLMVSAVDYVADAYYNEPDAKFETFNFWVMTMMMGMRLWNIIIFLLSSLVCIMLIVKKDVHL